MAEHAQDLQSKTDIENARITHDVISQTLAQPPQPAAMPPQPAVAPQQGAINGSI
jgi:hypothetical protein